MKIVSWNVNGINSCINKGLVGFIKKTRADFYLFQEIKASRKTINKEIFELENYTGYWFPAVKNGYSGVMTLSKKQPLRIITGLGDPLIDSEGRVLTLEFNKYYLVNAYFPHSQRKLKRLDFKLRFNDYFLKFVKKLKRKKQVIIGSDFNVAHKEIDLANPKQNTKNAGFRPEEREWFTNLLEHGFVDTYRKFTKSGEHYTWWTYRFNARKRNIGWRVDYFVVSKKLEDKVKTSKILSSVMGSDHCPITMTISSP